MAKTVIKGVNLGGWLVLEPWITPGLFEGTVAPDEFTYCDTADTARFKQLSRHRKSFITEKDFEWLAGQGIEAVRIPVGYWAFGDVKPFTGTIEYLDNAFVWAKKYGLKVLVCLHGAPGSQNGEMHSGRRGDIAWHTDGAQVEQTLRTIERLAERYKDRPELLGIELLNEPSMTIPKKLLKRYYISAYRVVRSICGRNTWVVFSDAFQPWRWSWNLHWPIRRLAYLDNHQYQIYTPEDKALDLEGHLRKTAGPVARMLRRIARHRRIIVGEWSAALDRQSLTGLQDAELDDAYRQYIAAQLQAYHMVDGWFYWTYRTEAGGAWDFRRMVELGIFPTSDKATPTDSKL